MLVEVLVGTILLALTTAAVLDGLDGAQKTGRKNKDRSAAATLAQQDLERLRALPPSVLNALDETRTVTVASVPYTVVSRADWVSDASGLASCVSSNTQSEYMKLTSTVHSPASVDEPVSATTFLTPPVGAFGVNTGTAAVKLTDRDGQPHAGIGVSLTGPGSEIGATNDLGCAIFAYIPIGNWTAQVNGGLVNWSGESPAESQVTVAVNKTSLTQLEVDVPASLRASFVTPAGVATDYKAISVANAKLANGVKSYTWSPATATRDVESLFPFHDGYGVYAGSCKASNPANWDSDYFETAGFADLDPGEMLQSVNVVVPQSKITVTQGGSPVNATVTVTQRDSAYGCTSTVVTTTVGSDGYIELSLPFGHYRLCATYNGRRIRTATSGTPLDPDLTVPPLEKATTLVVPTSGSSGGCP